MMKPVVLITGASTGIGAAAAKRFAREGFTVYAAARSMDKLEKLRTDAIHPVALDVTDDASMQACVSQVLDQEGRIDVLVNNAGYGSYGAVEDVKIADARRQFEVNVFGLARMTQLALPAMRKAGHGRIINISSMGGRIWTPFAAWYHATKFAVEGLSASLRAELKPFSIDVVLIEPGAIETPWGTIAAQHLRETSKDGAYQETAMLAAQKLEKRYTGGGLITKPEVIADCIVKAATVRRPRTRYLLGFGAKPMVYIQKLFGDRVYDALVRRVL